MDAWVYNSYVKTDDSSMRDELAKERSPYLFCDVCMHYPMEPVHGHFMCTACHNVTKCCELGPMTMEVQNA